jgi:hypothetical protein
LAAPAAGATALLLLALCGLQIGVRPAAAIAVVLLIAVASPITIYASRLSPPVFGLLAVALVVYPLLRFRHDDESLWLRLMLGAGFGLMPLLDDAFLLFWPLCWLWWARRAPQALGRPSHALFFLAPLLSGVLIFLAVNRAAWGGALHAPDGLPLWSHFWHEYYFHAAGGESYLFKFLLPRLALVFLNDGPVPLRVAAAMDLPAALRGQVFLGMLTWYPVLLAGWLGMRAMRRDEAAVFPLRLFGVGFWLSVFLAASGRGLAQAAEFDLSVLLPFWAGLLIGLGFFVDYHLFLLRGFFWKNILRLLFGAALLVSLGHAWQGAAESHIGDPPRQVLAVLPPAPLVTPADLGDEKSPAVILPASPREALFLNVNKTADWITRGPRAWLGAFRPGVNNWPIFAPVLLVLALLPWAGGKAVAWRLRDFARAEPPPLKKDERTADDEKDVAPAADPPPPA